MTHLNSLSAATSHLSQTQRLPHKAVILAAGLGTRMGGLSLQRPKPLLPLWGRSLLARTVDLLRDWGVRDILINTHWHATQIIHEALSLNHPECSIAISHEPDILGSGGALRKAEWFFDDQPFWLINSDIVARLNPMPMRDALAGRKTVAALWVTPDRGPRTVRVQHGAVSNFSDPRPGVEGTYTFCGLHLLTRQILDWVPPHGFYSIIEAYRNAMKNGWKVAATSIADSYWADAGSPDSYLMTHREMADHFNGCSKRPDIYIAPSAHVHPKADLANAIILDGAHVHAKARLRNAIIGNNTTVRGHVSGVATPAEDNLLPSQYKILISLGMNPASCTFIEWPARGSARQFARISNPKRQIVLMRYDPKRVENRYYTKQAIFLKKRGWPVPAILGDAPNENWAMLEDLGDHDLTSVIRSNRSRTKALYEKTLARVADLHGPVTVSFRRSSIPSMPEFDADLYRYERNLFTECYLEKRRHFDAKTIRHVTKDLQAVSNALKNAKKVLVHRDLQSSNIYWVNKQPVFIDFQGMRMGPAAYDLASLLCDPYVRLPFTTREHLLLHYMTLMDMDESFLEDYRYACIQRLIQAIGAYARLSNLPGCRQFGEYIAPAFSILNECINDVSGIDALKAVVQQEYDRFDHAQ